MDHGELNLPLRLRQKTLHRDIDRFKAVQLADLRRIAKADKQLRAQAKAAVEALTQGRLAELALKLSTTPAAVRNQLLSNAHWMPAVCLRALAADEVRCGPMRAHPVLPSSNASRYSSIAAARMQRSRVAFTAAAAQVCSCVSSFMVPPASLFLAPRATQPLSTTLRGLE